MSGSRYDDYDQLFHRTAKEVLTPVRIGNEEHQVIPSWAAGRVLRKLREDHPEIFSALLAEALRDNVRLSPTRAEQVTGAALDALPENEGEGT
jgi:hypothetical protein